MLIGEAGVASVSFEGETLLSGRFQGGLNGCDLGVEGGAGQGRPTRAHLDEAGLADSGHPLVESDIVGRDPRDHWFQGSAAFSSIVVGGCDTEPLPQDLGLAPDDSIGAGKLALKEMLPGLSAVSLTTITWSGADEKTSLLNITPLAVYSTVVIPVSRSSQRL